MTEPKNGPLVSFQRRLKLEQRRKMSTEEASKTSPTSRPTLASIYTAKKSGKLEENSVEVLKQQFQTDIQKNVQHFSGDNKILNR